MTLVHQHEIDDFVLVQMLDLLMKATKVTTRHNTRKHDTTQDNTSTTRHNTR